MTTSGVTASYGSYRFKPVPLATMSVEHFKTASRTIGGYYSLTLNGTLYPRSTGGGQGAKNLFEEKNRLMQVLNVDYDEFLIDFESASPDCAGTSVYGRPRVRSISFAESPDNWTDRMPYTIELEFTASSITGVADYITTDLNLESLTTDYSVTYTGPTTAGYWGTTSGVQQYFGPKIQVQRNISAKGLNLGLATYNTTGMPDYSGAVLEKTAYDNALEYVGTIAVEAPDLGLFTNSNVLDVSGTIGSGFASASLITRDISSSQEEGTVSVNDTFMFFPIGGSLAGAANTLAPAYKVADTFSFDISDSEGEGTTTIALNGSIQGFTSYSLAEGFMSAPAGSTAIDEAKDYLTLGLMGDEQFFKRANYLYTETSVNGFNGTQLLALNPSPISKSFGYNISDGAISYAVSYNNKSGPCLTGVISESINMTRNRAIPVIATQTVLGRANGPIFQSLGTVTAKSQDMSIEAVVAPPSGGVLGGANTCFSNFEGAPNYESVVLAAEAHISGASNSIFRTSDNETFDPKIGRYTRSISWTYTPC
tara:strand:+ start:540 stop:2153 length:1614 start_codon:yes stop_codon:yes gene_type:complete